MTINNPTEFRFNHDRLRANNVVIIPTPTNNSNLNSIMESNNDSNKYYNFGNYTDVRYYKTVTPKTSISGMNVNCYKENDTPQSATVYKADDTYHVEDTGYTGQTVSFNHQDVIFNSENIPDEEIFFKDSENAPIALTVFDDTNSVTLTNHATKDSFEFKVPSCVHKVEIEHNTSHEAPAGSNKAKIHIDLDDSSKDYYINEKHGNDNVVIVTNKYGMQLKNVLSDVTDASNTKVFLIELGTGNLYYVEQISSGTQNLRKVYWDTTVGETNHIYSFKDNLDEEGIVFRIFSFTKKLENYELLMGFEGLSNELKSTATRMEYLESGQETPLTYTVGQGIKCNPDLYYTNGVSNFPGLNAFCQTILMPIMSNSNDSCVGCFFLEGTNYVFKINLSNVNEAWAPHPLSAEDIEGGLQVFTGGIEKKLGKTYDDTCTSQLNFGALCTAFIEAKPTTDSGNVSSDD